MVNYFGVYSRQAARRYRKKQTKSQKKKMGRYGNVNVGRIASDLVKVKKMLNTEHKSIITNYGSATTSNNPNIIYTENPHTPTRTNPVIARIGYPYKGTANTNRIGSSIKSISLSSKILAEFLFPGTTDANNNQKRIINPYVCIYLMARKSGDAVATSSLPTIGDLFYPDSQGHYTEQCLRRKDTFNEYIVLDKKKISAKLNNNLVTTQSNEAYLEEKSAILATNKQMYFKWKTGQDGTQLASSYFNCQGPMLFIVILTNVADIYSSEQSLTSATIFNQTTLTFVDN